MITMQLDLVAFAIACFAVAFGLVELYFIVVLGRRVRVLEAQHEHLARSADYQQVRKLLATYEARALGFEKLYLDLLQREDHARSNGSGQYA